MTAPATGSDPFCLTTNITVIDRTRLGGIIGPFDNRTPVPKEGYLITINLDPEQGVIAADLTASFQPPGDSGKIDVAVLLGENLDGVAPAESNDLVLPATFEVTEFSANAATTLCVA